MSILTHTINKAATPVLKAVAFCLLLCTDAFFSLRAQDKGHIVVLYPINRVELVQDFAENAVSLARLDQLLNSAEPGSVRLLVITSASSPDGSVALNRKLSRQRGQSLRDYILASHPELKGRIQLQSVGEDWDTLLSSLPSDKVLRTQRILSILGILDPALSPEVRESRLRALPEFRYIADTYLPKLRSASLEMSISPVQSISSITPDFKPTVQVSCAPQLFSPTAVKRAVRKEIVSYTDLFALKTNLLFDAVTALNVEVEVPIGTRYSVMAEDVFPWWHIQNKYCFQMWEMGVEGRYWLRPWNPAGTGKLRGWFFGTYVMSAKYDFQWERDLIYRGEYWSTGATAGWCCPLGKKKRVNLELSLAVGYLQSHYQGYMPTDSYDKLIRNRHKVGTVDYFGPTKAKVSLVIPIRARHKKEVTVYE